MKISSHHDLAKRIRAEYLEMPDMRLTVGHRWRAAQRFTVSFWSSSMSGSRVEDDRDSPSFRRG